MKKAFRFLVLMLVTGVMLSSNVTSAVKKIALNKKSLSMEEQQEYTLKLKGANKKITWTSSDKSVATVKNGVVKAKRMGKCTVTAKSGGKKYACTVSVKVPKVEEDEISYTVTCGGRNGRELTTVITNNASTDVYSGQPFVLEKYEDGEWQKVPFKEGIAYTCEAWVISPGKKGWVQKIALDGFFDGLTAGKYRIVKQICTYYKNFDVYGEFTLD